MSTSGAARRRKRERELARLADEQHGVIARQQLLRAGLSPRTIRRWVEAGRLFVLHRDVYAFGHERLSEHGRWLAPAFEEADRLGLLEIAELDLVCGRGFGRRGVKPLRELLESVRDPTTQSPLEAQVIALYRAHSLPIPETNVKVLGLEVDAFWPDQRLMVEADGYTFHGHRAAFERDRARDTEMQVAGYRVVRLTHRRLEDEPGRIAAQLRHLLADVPSPGGQKRPRESGTSVSDDVPSLGGQKGPSGSGTSAGQGTVEWVGVVCLVALLLAGLLAVGVRVPGGEVARAVVSRVLCAVAMGDRCGDEPALIAAYGSEVGELVRRHMPSLLFERGSRAVPVDFRRCRLSECGDGAAHGYVRRTRAGLPVTAFVHVIDCRPDTIERTVSAGANCSGSRAGNLYIQYWTYYADSTTLSGVPIAGDAGYHRDDWEGVMLRIRPGREVDQRATSHHGFNQRPGPVGGWASDIGATPIRNAEEAIGLRADNGWGPETRILIVSGGSHAGNTAGIPHIERLTPSNRVHLIPLEPIAATTAARFAISPPWRKRAWWDPETDRTD